MSTYKRIQVQLIMNHSQYLWLMQHLHRIEDCAKAMDKKLSCDPMLKPIQACYKSFYQYFLYEAAIHQLNHQERECVKRYIDALWKAYMCSAPFPKLVFRNLLKRDFTYHCLDMRSLMNPAVSVQSYHAFIGSTIYQHNRKWFICLYVKAHEKTNASVK